MAEINPTGINPFNRANPNTPQPPAASGDTSESTVGFWGADGFTFGDILDLIHDLWPSRKEWPVKAADRCYRQMKGQRVETVRLAVERLVGERPPSPASLQVKVAEVAAVEARYGDRVAVLPEPADDGAALKRSVQIRGGRSWAEWLEETSR